LAVITGKADYVLTSSTTAMLAAKHHPELALLPKEYINDSAGIAMNKKDTVLLQQINEVLVRYKVDGTLKDIIDRWVRMDGSDYLPVEVPAVKTGQPLRVGMSASREPMCFISNGKFSGLDAELIERIAYELGRPVEYSDMKFSALIAAIESGRIDLVISNIMITAERQKRVNFSEAYFPNPQILTTLSTRVVAKPNWFMRVRDSFINNLVVERRYLMIFEGLKQTLIITFFAIILGTIVGGVICFLRMSRRKISVGFAKIYIDVMRGTPILVLLMIFFYVLFASSGLSATVVAVITFALNMGAYSSEMFRTAIQSVEKGQTEAGIALGFTKVQTFIYVVFPQALQRVIPVYKGEAISLLKMTSIVGYIAVVDLTKASDIIRSRTFDAFFPLIVVAIIYFSLAYLLGIALDKLNTKISSAK
jgi:polar amino acid transport system substrate-binding protein